jgi:hypothetical protein
VAIVKMILTRSLYDSCTLYAFFAQPESAARNPYILTLAEQKTSELGATLGHYRNSTYNYNKPMMYISRVVGIATVHGLDDRGSYLEFR